jgi:hypothetical protein
MTGLEREHGVNFATIPTGVLKRSPVSRSVSHFEKNRPHFNNIKRVVTCVFEVNYKLWLAIRPNF